MVLIIILLAIICLLLFLLLKKQKHIMIHNKTDILKGMELERRKKEYHDYLKSYYYDTIPPISVKDGYKKIEKEVLGYYLDD